MDIQEFYAEQTVEQTFPVLAYKEEVVFDDLIAKEAQIAVVGLGYVGLPLAIHMASKFKVVGFDINKERITGLRQKTDASNEVKRSDFDNKDIVFSHSEAVLKEAKFFVVTVPTPINEDKKPDLSPLIKATQLIAKYLKKGDYVVYESTVYPGCTEEVCIPLLEDISGLRLNEDFKTGYSPERINPGDEKHTFTNIEKIVSGSDNESLEEIAKVYDAVINAKIYKAPSIKTAEAAKITENIQRDVNIALMNELSQIFTRMGIKTQDVLAAAATKWSFQYYHPGLVGGHCIGIDPYYLINKAKELQYSPELLETARKRNEGMVQHIISQLKNKLHYKKMAPKATKILLKGMTFKENVSDIRNSKAAELALGLIKEGYDVTVEDPCANAAEVHDQYGIQLENQSEKQFHAVIVAVAHKSYGTMSYGDVIRQGYMDTIVFDLKGNLQHKFPESIYMTL